MLIIGSLARIKWVWINRNTLGLCIFLICRKARAVVQPAVSSAWQAQTHQVAIILHFSLFCVQCLVVFLLFISRICWLILCMTLVVTPPPQEHWKMSSVTTIWWFLQQILFHSHSLSNFIEFIYFLLHREMLLCKQGTSLTESKCRSR